VSASDEVCSPDVDASETPVAACPVENKLVFPAGWTEGKNANTVRESLAGRRRKRGYAGPAWETPLPYLFTRPGAGRSWSAEFEERMVEEGRAVRRARLVRPVSKGSRSRSMSMNLTAVAQGFQLLFHVTAPVDGA
jgi:hypothetical protein